MKGTLSFMSGEVISNAYHFQNAWEALVFAAISLYQALSHSPTKPFRFPGLHPLHSAIIFFMILSHYSGSHFTIFP